MERLLNAFEQLRWKRKHHPRGMDAGFCQSADWLVPSASPVTARKLIFRFYDKKMFSDQTISSSHSIR